MTLTVLPIPRTPAEVIAWFAALGPADLRLALLGTATASGAALLLVLGVMALSVILRKWT